MRSRASVLWCYKDELSLSSHKQKRMKQINRAKQRGLWDEDVDDPFELFISSTEIRYCYYKDSHKVLGRTYGMLVLQDFDGLTPNLLCRTVETVKGGGIVVILLSTMTSLKQLYTLTMDVHKRFRTHAHSTVKPRFNERFLLALAQSRAAMFLDDEFNVLGVSDKPIEPVATKSHVDTELEDFVHSLEDRMPVGPLLAKTKTVDQARIVLTLLTALLDHENCTYAITAARGRGKSAALGLSIAGAVALNYSNIVVTAPTPDNLQAFFEFLLVGLEALGYRDNEHYRAIKGTGDLKHCVIKVEVTKNHRQTVQYLVACTPALQTDLLVIDEAAALPLPIVKKLLGQYPTFISSTIHGYEGTGRSLSLKLLTSIRRVKEIKMERPIRYAPDDPVETWLSDLLCLEATIPFTLSGAPPSASECSLYLVDRDTLFSGHRASEHFLHQAMSLLVSSHYRNSPNDLQMLSDAPAHLLFVLLPPLGSTLPEVLCVLQVCLEGQIARDIVQKQLEQGKRSAGDLIPYTLSEYYQDAALAELSGVRVVRIAVHPDLQNAGYGSHSLNELVRFFNGEFKAQEDLQPLEVDEELQEEHDDIEIKPRTNTKPLLRKLTSLQPPEIDYIGVAFGLSWSLLKFWKKAGFKPLYVRSGSSEVTGEHSAIMLRPQETFDISGLTEDFQHRIRQLLGFELRDLSVQLASDLLEAIPYKNVTAEYLDFTAHDLKRLESFARNMTDYNVVLDLVPKVGEQYFKGHIEISLTPIQSAVLTGIAFQRVTFRSLSEQLELPESQIRAYFAKVVAKVVKELRVKFEAEVEASLPLKRPATEAPASPSKKLASS
eukprot:CAMPEP_0204906730 /NCGR_PEP_ID=MMETSP1397-20131031/6127_1 /ASSEMBLY_ACC=CAM_ASM_000891 /TAXON_ID=49980 /ORGANISM="Climacostomum Climacostomum virens, Strain Stock W-24" /LENGTH=829 /DNA_ID=CAMNT_0052075733 /DNA_START=819 /DNA_END=3308 /DNA_ORIENTATION=+